jgi:hypothetical protein
MLTAPTASATDAPPPGHKMSIDDLSIFGSPPPSFESIRQRLTRRQEATIMNCTVRRREECWRPVVITAILVLNLTNEIPGSND